MRRQNAPLIANTKTLKEKSQSRLPTKNLDQLPGQARSTQLSPHSLLVKTNRDPSLQTYVDRHHEQQLVPYRQEDKFMRPSSTSILRTDNRRARLSRERSLFKRKISTWQPRMPVRQARRAVDSMTKVTKVKQRQMPRSWYPRATKTTWFGKRFWKTRIRIRSSCSEFQMRTKWHSSC